MPGRLLVETDGGSRGNPGPAGYGALVRDAETGELLAERAGYLGVVSNNVAEYSGLLAGLRAAVELDPHAAIEVRADSRLVVEQMSGRWKIKHAGLKRLADEALTIVPPAQVTYTWVPRAENAAADALANEAMDTHTSVSRDPGRRGPKVGAAPVAVGAAATLDEAQPVTVVLVRHGETPLTVSKGYSGSSVPGPPLTQRGREQAARAADLIDRIQQDSLGEIPTPTEVLSSPMVRAQETAAVVAGRLGLPVRVEPLVAECDFGAWEGLTVAQIALGWPGQLKRWHDDASVRAPGGESIEGVGARMRAAFESIRAAGVGRTVVVVTHSVSVRAAVGVAIGANSSAWARIRVAPASVSIVRLWADGSSEVTVVGAPSGV